MGLILNLNFEGALGRFALTNAPREPTGIFGALNTGTGGGGAKVGAGAAFVPLTPLVVLPSSGSMISEGFVILIVGGSMLTSSISSKMIEGLEGRSFFCFLGEGRSSSSTSSMLTLGGLLPFLLVDESPFTVDEEAEKDGADAKEKDSLTGAPRRKVSNGSTSAGLTVRFF